MPRVMTAPIAIIKHNGNVIGKMKNVRITETLRRGRVSGLGELTPQELPALEWNGTLNAQFYLVDFRDTGVPNANPRTINANTEEYVDNVLLDENGVQIDIFKKVDAGTVNATTGLIESILEPFATIESAFIDREGFDITEGQISGKDQDFTYMKPILYTV